LLRTGQSIGREVKYDVHIETDKQNCFYQIKHSVQKKNNGGTINLTTSDKNLWKTISIWVKLIVDEKDGPKGIDNQLVFLAFLYVFVFLLLDKKEFRIL